MTDVTTMTLTEFYLARIAEREAVARAAEQTWESDRDGGWWIGCEDETQAHFALNDPTRVLAECAAQRAIVALAATITDMAGEIRGEWPHPHVAVIDGDLILRALALPYADREGYDEAWRL